MSVKTPVKRITRETIEDEKGTLGQTITHGDYLDHNPGDVLEFQGLDPNMPRGGERYFGIKENRREEYPSMFELMAWNMQNKQGNIVRPEDFTKKPYLPSNRIQKNVKSWMSESHDNFRKFTYSPEKARLYMNWLEAQMAGADNKEMKDVNERRLEELYKSIYTKSYSPDKYCSLKEQAMYKKSKEEMHQKERELEEEEMREQIRKENEWKNQGILGKSTKGGRIRPSSARIGGQRLKGAKARTKKEPQSAQLLTGGKQPKKLGDRQEDGASPQDIYTDSPEKVKTTPKKKLKGMPDNCLHEIGEIPADIKPAQLKRIKGLLNTTRWLPDSAFTTYFGKPAFGMYGTGNTKPIVGGYIYGDYLLSHNINPQVANNNPEYQQVFGNTDVMGRRMPQRKPQPPRKLNEENRFSKQELEEARTRNPIHPKPLKEEGKQIQKPDLFKSQYFLTKDEFKEQQMEMIAKKMASMGKDKDGKSAKEGITSAKTLPSKPAQTYKGAIMKAAGGKTDSKRPTPRNESLELRETPPVKGEGRRGSKQGGRKVDEEIEEEEEEEEEGMGEGEEEYEEQESPEGLRKMTPQELIELHVRTLARTQPLHELDPRNYKYVPSHWLTKIRPAGKPLHGSGCLDSILKNEYSRKELDDESEDMQL